LKRKKPVQVYSRLDGRPAIGLSIKKQSGANAVEISDQVIAELMNLEKAYSKENLTFEFIQDNSDFTKAAARSVGLDLVLAIIPGFAGNACFFYTTSGMH